MPAWPLPEYLKKYAASIATMQHLDSDWLNATTSLMMIRLEEFPREVWTGLETEEFGPCLKVTFMGRIGLIYLKSMARISRDEPRDLGDLEAMTPTAPEMKRIVRWLFAKELIPKANPKPALKLLTDLGYENLATEVERDLA